MLVSVDFKFIDEDESGVAYCGVPCRHVAVGQCLDFYIACLYRGKINVVFVYSVFILCCQVGVCPVENVGEVLAVV